MIKLHNKDFTLQIRSGFAHSLSGAKMTTVIGELLFCHDTGQLYIAQDTAGESDSVLRQIPTVDGSDVNHEYGYTGTFDTKDAAWVNVTVKNGIITNVSLG